MKKVLLIILCFVGILAAFVLWQNETRQVAEPVVPKPVKSAPKPARLEPVVPAPIIEIPRILRYSFTLKNTGNRVLKKANFWAHAPVKETGTQKVVHIDASHPFEVLTDQLGNQILHFEFVNIPPYASKMVNVTTKLMLTKEVKPMAENNLQRFLGEEPFVEISHKSLQKTASRLTTSRQIFNWVARHIKYAGYIRENRGALYALREKSGDCTEYMYLFTALARIKGIPTRGIGGYVYGDDAILKPKDYHNWAEFYQDGKWHLADPQNKVFMDQQSDYIAMRIIYEESDLVKFSRFWAVGEGLSVRMDR